MLIQDFLRTTPNGVEELKKQFAIDCKRHGDYPQLCLFKYNQIDSPMGNPLVQEARGLILDESDNWKVICYTFCKFFNHKEPHAAQIDWSTAVVEEKLDGGLMQLYRYDNKWHVATSGVPDASGVVNGYDKTFKDLFWETWKKQGLDIELLHQDYCYALELTGPMNRVVVDYAESKLSFIGCRLLPDLREVTLLPWRAPQPRSFPVSSVEDCIKDAEALNPLQQEGFVVRDRDFNRIKIKSPAYIMLHHAKDSLSKKRMCEVIRKGEYDEFKLAIDSLPELKKVFDDLDAKHRSVVSKIHEMWDWIRDVESQKDFASVATKLGPASTVLFLMRKTNWSVAQVLASSKISLDNYMRIIEA